MREIRREIDSLQAKALKKMDPREIATLPETLKMEGLNEIATRIQRNMTRRPYNVYRKGEKMTTAAMKRQLIKGADSSPIDNLLNKLKDIVKAYVNTNAREATMVHLRNIAENKYLFKNLERDLVVGLYNYIYDLSEDEKMTTAAMKRQLIKDANILPVDYVLSYLKDIVKAYVNTNVREATTVPLRNIAENRYLLKNLERDLVVGLYNNIYDLSEDEEDRLYRARGRNNKSSRLIVNKRRKTKKKKHRKRV